MKNYFIQRIRRPTDTDSVRYWTLTDDAPEWLRAAVRDAHNGSIPHDWVFEQCAVTWDAILNEDLAENGVHEFVNGCVDVYIHNVFSWAADWCNSTLFEEAEESVKDLGGFGDHTVCEILQMVQYEAISYIVQCMLNAYNDNCTDIDGES